MKSFNEWLFGRKKREIVPPKAAGRGAWGSESDMIAAGWSYADGRWMDEIETQRVRKQKRDAERNAERKKQEEERAKEERRARYYSPSYASFRDSHDHPVKYKYKSPEPGDADWNG